MRRLAKDQLEELAKANALANSHHAEFECGLISALRLSCVELPRMPRGSGSQRSLKLDALHVVVDQPAKRHRWNGSVFHVLANPSLASLPPDARRDYAPRMIVEGVYVTHPLLVWAQMARFLDREELTVLGDSMMRRNQSTPHFVPEDFRALLELLPVRFKGRSKCLWALERMRENTDSSMETRLRLKLEQEPLPDLESLEINYRVAVNEDGGAMFLDMALPHLQIGIEYAGRHHAEQWSDDLARQSALTAVAWEIVTASSETMRDGARWGEFVLQLCALMLQQRERLHQ